MLFSSLPNLCFVLGYSFFLFARFEGRISEEEEENSIDILARFISIFRFLLRAKIARGGFLDFSRDFKAVKLTAPPSASQYIFNDEETFGAALKSAAIRAIKPTRKFRPGLDSFDSPEEGERLVEQGDPVKF